MCGIVGKVRFDENPIVKRDIELMSEAIRHRGPDDDGVYLSPDHSCGLGHRRLAIIDLSPKGKQPMRYHNRYEIVFNGEIYNYQMLKKALESDGYRFASESDTEVILALYDKYGERCVTHLRGMFAFAIYDEKTHLMFCARDRVGKKPFKYYCDKNVFLFASELKAILTQSECKKELDYEAIHHYLTYQYTPNQLTGFTGIKKLLPGHSLLLDTKSGKMTTKRYWKLDFSHTESHTEDEWGDIIRHKLDESVKMRMIADVPIGAFLSGGIDSSAVVAYMSRHSTKPVKTFSIGFADATHNELAYARQIADQFGCEHSEFMVEPDAVAVLPLLVKHYEEPYADSSALPTYYVSQLTRQHVTVAVNGDGGDENFAGYTRYSMLKAEQVLAKFGVINSIVTTPTLRYLSQALGNDTLKKMHRLSAGLRLPYPERAAYDVSYFTDAQKNDLYTAEFAEQTRSCGTSYAIMAHFFDHSGSFDPINQALYADFMTYLPNALLAKVDIATMAVGLEGRSPFLDHELIEMCARIPSNLKLRGVNDKKYILKKALAGVIPDNILYRPKHGFSVPVDLWFRHELQHYLADHVLSEHSQIASIIRPDKLSNLVDRHTAGKVNIGKELWALLTLELWLEEYFG